MASNSFLQSIQLAVGDEAVHVFEDSELTKDEDIGQLCHETMKDLFPGTDGKTLVIRSKIWKIISTPKPSLPLESENSTRVRTHPGAQFDDNEITNAETYVPEEKKPKKVHVQSPEYTVYKDRDLDSAAKSGNIAPELRQRLVRATINNMMAATYAPPFNRLPTRQEINEMAKSLIVTYPCLKDNDTGHGLLSKQLQKRLYNEKAKSKKKEKPKVKKLSATEQHFSKVLDLNSTEVTPSKSSYDDLVTVVDNSNDDITDESFSGIHYNLEKS